jgi:hypothetical protein
LFIETKRICGWSSDENFRRLRERQDVVSCSSKALSTRAAASRLTWRYSGNANFDFSDASGIGFFEQPELNFTHSMRRTASSMRDCGTAPSFTSAIR